jgi:hypothetical protein
MIIVLLGLMVKADLKPPEPLSPGSEDEMDWQLVEQVIPKRQNEIVLQGFGVLGSKNNDAALKSAFLSFIEAIEAHEIGRHEMKNGRQVYLAEKKFPIKIVRHDGQYFYSSVIEHEESKVLGSKESNRSQSILTTGQEKNRSKNIYGGVKVQGYEQKLHPKDKLTKELLRQLDKEQVISKIVISHPTPSSPYTIKKYGMAHMLYRGVNNAGHILTLGTQHPEWK